MIEEIILPITLLFYFKLKSINDIHNHLTPDPRIKKYVKKIIALARLKRE